MYRKLCLVFLVVCFVGSIAQAGLLITAIQRRGSTNTLPQIAPGPLAVGSTTYVDRAFTYTQIPAYLVGADYVMTANSDKNVAAYELDVTLAAQCTELSLFIDNRVGDGSKTDPPTLGGGRMDWVGGMGFVSTGNEVVNSDTRYTIYSKLVPAGTITLGAQGQSGTDMYCVAAIASIAPPQAWNPTPNNGGQIASTNVLLKWSAGLYAAAMNGHHVYFGTDIADVNNGTGSTDKGLRTDPNYYVASLTAGTTYYWRVDEVNAPAHPGTYKGNVWRFTVTPLTAWNPNPPDGTEYEPNQFTLRWRAGLGAVNGHAVYFGDSFADVNSAAVGSTTSPYKATVPMSSDPNWLTPVLENNKTYYWRIDEITSWPGTVYKGEVWSFTTMPYIKITDPELVGWWKFDEGRGTTTVDWSGHNRNATLQNQAQWVSGHDDGNAVSLAAATYDYVEIPAGLVTTDKGSVCVWIKTTQTTVGMIFYGSTGSTNDGFGDANELHLNMTNSPAGQPEFFLRGSPNVRFTMGKTVNDNTWHHLAATWDKTSNDVRLYLDGTPMAAAPHTGFNFNLSGRIRLGRPGAATRNYDGSLDDVWLYDKALTQAEIKKIASSPKAGNPNPANNASDIPPGVIFLAWEPGNSAAKHDVYFSDNWDDMNNADSSDPIGPDKVYKSRQDPNYYSPVTLNKWGQTYYWRVDEVNGLDIWRGDIWRFTTRDYLIVDDFESYNNTDNIIYNTWKANGGAKTGYPDPNYAELTIVHRGGQALPVDYNDTKSPYYSEAYQTFATTQDWAAHGVNLLSLWLRGHPASVGSLIQAPVGTYTMTARGADIWDVPDIRHPSTFHDEFHYAYTQVLSGDCVIIAKVESISNTDPWAKAGVMMRDSLDANSTHVMMCMTPGNGATFQYRLTTAGISTSTNQTGIITPYWVAVQRTGNTFIGAYCYDGVSWGQLGSIDIVMADPIYIGLCLTSHNATATCTAVFSNVSTHLGVPTLTNQDIGIKSNTAAPLYVTLQDSSFKTATVINPDANAVLSTAWQEWNIPMSSFTGITKTAITKLTVGVGNKGSPQAVGFGTIYVDDIRLYMPRCMPDLLRNPADFTGDCIVDYADIAIMAEQWLASGSNLEADVYYDNNVNLKDYAILADTWLEELLWPQ